MDAKRLVAAALGLFLATSARAQIGPGELAPPAGDVPSIGEGSQEFMDDPAAGNVPSIGESSGEEFAPEAGDAPSIGDANEPFEQPSGEGQLDEGPPDGRLRPFGD